MSHSYFNDEATQWMLWEPEPTWIQHFGDDSTNLSLSQALDNPVPTTDHL